MAPPAPPAPAPAPPPAAPALQVHDAAHVVHMLASEQSGKLTGKIVTIGSGQSG